MSGLDWSKIDVILLDQGETFMFENDRFSEGEDYARTYRNIGGEALSDDQVNKTVRTVVESLFEAYDDGEHDDCFPTVLDIVSNQKDLPHGEAELIDDVVAEHELGTISPERQQAIRTLARTHPLGIISNVFAQPARFEHNLQRAGIFDCFDHLVWSSTHGAIKPSPQLFQVALDHWQLPPGRMLYVGNDATRDVAGAKQVGMKSAWINLNRIARPSHIPEPDLVLSDLTDLPGHERSQHA